MIALLVILVFSGTFLLAALSVAVAALIQFRRGAASGLARVAEAAGETPLLLRQEPFSTLPIWRQLLSGLDFSSALKQRIDQAGLSWTVGRVTLSMLLLAALGFALFFDAKWAPTGSAFVAAWVAGSLPYWIIRRKRDRRLRQIEAQFPDVLESMARAMRAGHALSSAIALMAAETPVPLGPEFRKTSEEHRLGMPWNVALENLSARVPIPTARLFASAVLVQSQSGGKLTDILERLAQMVRETEALRGEVRALSAQGRLTGAILTGLPLLIAVIMYVTNPDYIGLLFANPKGRILVWYAVICVILGHLVIQRILKVRAPQ